MAHHRIPLASDNEDIASAAAFWWDDGGVFIEQVETQKQGEKIVKHLLLFGPAAIPGLIAALQQFLERK